MPILTNTCKICKSKTISFNDEKHNVGYTLCETCEFIAKKSTHYVSKEAEKKQYDRHDNTFESTGYVKMFEDLIRDFVVPLKNIETVLEFGSGPGPVLYELLKRQGFDVNKFDPFYNPDETYKQKSYDLITSTEVAEHFHNPMSEFRHIVSLLNPGGYLLLMTKFHKNDITHFLNWWYRRDVTHVSFYSVKTFEVIAQKLNLEIVKHNSKNIILLRKKVRI
ncbi:MAG: class I SAM-dependent methyltransferase, partial [Candidatus Izimaplasma sp.]|nr:class I SAM-dependent methyltransferase [Candidatus Izimaplasma bacterium]